MAAIVYNKCKIHTLLHIYRIFRRIIIYKCITRLGLATTSVCLSVCLSVLAEHCFFRKHWQCCGFIVRTGTLLFLLLISSPGPPLCFFFSAFFSYFQTEEILSRSSYFFPLHVADIYSLYWTKLYTARNATFENYIVPIGKVLAPQLIMSKAFLYYTVWRNENKLRLSFFTW